MAHTPTKAVPGNRHTASTHWACLPLALLAFGSLTDCQRSEDGARTSQLAGTARTPAKWTEAAGAEGVRSEAAQEGRAGPRRRRRKEDKLKNREMWEVVRCADTGVVLQGCRRNLVNIGRRKEDRRQWQFGELLTRSSRCRFGQSSFRWTLWTSFRPTSFCKEPIFGHGARVRLPKVSFSFRCSATLPAFVSRRSVFSFSALVA